MPCAIRSGRDREGGRGFDVSWRDAGAVFQKGLEIRLETLPSRCEIFFIFADNPQNKFVNEKTKRILGFTFQDSLSISWSRSRPK